MIMYLLLIILSGLFILALYRTYRFEKDGKMFFYHLFKIILKPIFCIWYPYKAYNKEAINVSGPVIFCGNHIHLMDQCLVILLNKRPIHYMAKIEYFQNPKTKWFFKMVGCIPVNRQIHDKNAKNLAIDVLKNGNQLGIFPEGTRNKTDKVLLPFKFGAVSMAKKTDATIIPFAIKGHYKFRTKDLSITFGSPFKVGNDSVEEANERLYKEVLSLLDSKGN